MRRARCRHSGAGLLEEKTETTKINELSKAIFQSGLKNTRFVDDDPGVSSALKELLPPDFATDSTAATSIGFVHRKLSDSDIYFVVNSGNHAVATTASVRETDRAAQWWDPFSGKITPAQYTILNGRTDIPLSLAPYESRILVFAGNAHAAAPTPTTAPEQLSLDISGDWKVTFLRTGQTVTMQHLRSWTEDESTRFYSGRAVYEKTVDIPESFTQSAQIVLDFGPGTPIEPGLQMSPGMQALLDGPVREAAVIVVNGKRAGSIWHPPYELDIKPFLHTGSNRLEITVGNLAINEMAGEAAPDYRLLNLRYGERFVPQDMQGLRPLPCGILKPVTLRAEVGTSRRSQSRLTRKKLSLALSIP